MIRYLSTKFLFFFSIMFISVPSVFAGGPQDINFVFPADMGTFTYLWGANRFNPGDPLKDFGGQQKEWSTTGGDFIKSSCTSSPDPNCKLISVTFKPSLEKYENFVYKDGTGTYSVYKLPNKDLTSVGIVFGLKLSGNSSYQPIVGSGEQQLKIPTSVTGKTARIYVISRLVSTGEVDRRLLPYPVPQKTVLTGNFTFENSAGVKEQTAVNINMIGFKVEYDAQVCQPFGIDNIDLKDVDIAQLRSVGDVSSTSGDTTLKVDCSRSGAVIYVNDYTYATISDASDPDTSKKYLSIEQCPDCAKGVAVQLFFTDKTDQPIKIGRQTAHKQPSGSAQFKMKVQGGSNYPSQQIYARIVRTDKKIKLGTIKAQAVVTYSYQ